MSKSIGSSLPLRLLERLDGKQMEAWAGRVIMACSTDEQGRPHPCLLSYTEVAAASPSELRLAPYGNSRLVKNIARDGHVTLMFVDQEVSYYVKGRGEVALRSMKSDFGLALVRVQITEILDDAPVAGMEDEARLTTGIEFAQPDMGKRIAHAREVIAELLAFPG
jgi:hypothetical protein